jgi:hypothetical protein
MNGTVGRAQISMERSLINRLDHAYRRSGTETNQSGLRLVARQRMILARARLRGARII